MKRHQTSSAQKTKKIEYSEQLKVWEAYIQANEAIIDEKSKPIEVKQIVDIKQEKNRWNEPVLNISLAVNQKNLISELISALEFRKVIPNRHYVDYNNNFIYLNQLNQKSLLETQGILKEFHLRYSKFTEYNSKPAIWGKISSLKYDYSNLSSLIGLSTELGEDETVHCTMEEIRSIDKFIGKHQYVRREPEVGVVSVIRQYIDSEIIKRRLSERINIEGAIIKDKRRKYKGDDRAKQWSITDYSVIIENYSGSFENLETTLEDFGLFRENWTGEYQFLDDTGKVVGIKKTTEQCAESLWLYQRMLSFKYTNVKTIKLCGTFKPKDINRFLKENKQECLRFLSEEGFNVSQKNDTATLAFDVLNKHQLKENIDKLESLSLVQHNLNSLGDEFKYKVRLSVDNPDLTEIGLSLKNVYKDDVDFEFSQNQLALYFKFFSHSNDFVNLLNELEELERVKAIKVSLNESSFPLKFYFNIDEETRRLLFAEQLDSLAGCEFYWLKEIESTGETKRHQKVYLGKLDARKSKFEQLVFTLPLDSEVNKGYSELIKEFYQCDKLLGAVNPDLSGDRSKNNYLKQAIEKITNPVNLFGKKPANDNIGAYIFDSSKAKASDPNVLQDEIENVRKNLISNKINQSQIESVAKALIAEDLAILQGPPGSGKTTVISEVIWQSIIKNQNSRLLLTSESNLAVDNALGRLATPKSMLVKPLRFGRNIQEEEGKHFQIDRIERWATVDHKVEFVDQEGGNVNNNAIQSWMYTIACRSNDSLPKYQSILGKWRNGLNQPSYTTKKEFKDIYLKHINVIGNTCSSAGSPDFVINYQKLYNPEFKGEDAGKIAYSFKNGTPLRSDVASRLKPVEFETVIMDEASKSTPPELLLPLTFGKRSIIIGDHRQLPPSLNEQDFKEILETIGKADLAKNWSQEDYQVSQFERLFLNKNVSSSLRGSFNKQYRMHPQINKVIEQFYNDDGGLSCGLPQDQVDDPNLGNPSSRYHGFYHEGFIGPESHTIWVNVDEPELKDGTSRVNESEVEAIRRVLSYLQNSKGFDEFMAYWDKEEDQEIGLISFYGKQLNRLNSLQEEFPRLKLLTKTVDRFQGMERNIIIVSTVRSNKIIDTPHQKPSFIKYPDNQGYKRNESLGFAETPQRLNVALSRAKRLLIVVGNAAHFSRNPKYANVVDAIKEVPSPQPTFIDYKLLSEYV